MAHKTPLYDQHLKHQGSMVDFHNWMMPLHYGSQLLEHQATRTKVGLFDISHMSCIDMKGPKVQDFLSVLLANNILKLQPGRALYTCMLNEAGGIIDDLIVYQLNESSYRLIFNSSTLDDVLAWLKLQASSALDFVHQSSVAMMAIQGPGALALMQSMLPSARTILEQMPSFSFILRDAGALMISRTGYTGEDGFELVMPASEIVKFWQGCYEQGGVPCGLGARDTLRLEAGLNLNGSDMDITQTPLSSNLGWTVSWDDREFCGKSALSKLKESKVYPRLHGVITPVGRYVLRTGMQVVLDNHRVGVVTSGTWSPTLERGIAFARFDGMSIGESAHIILRGQAVQVEVVKPPFYVRQKHTKIERCNIG